MIFGILLYTVRIAILIFGFAFAISYYIKSRLNYLYGVYDKENYKGVYSKWGAYPINQRTHAEE